MALDGGVRREWEPTVLDDVRRPRRFRLTWRRALAVGATVVVLAGGIFVLTIPTWYQPLEHGSVSGLSGGREIAAADLGIDHPMVIGYQDRTYAYGMLSLRNDGRLSVRVEQIGTPDQPEHSLVRIDSQHSVLPPPNDYAHEGAPFQPFTLHPGEERGIAVALWMDNCEFYRDGTSASVMSVPVRYRILGMARRERIDLRGGWTVRGPVAGGCPRTS